jgi:hypothetical protein
MNRIYKDRIKGLIQSTYDYYRIYQIKASERYYYGRFKQEYGEIKRPDPTEYFKFWNRLSSFVNPDAFHIYYTLHGIKDLQMVPNAVYKAYIEPSLNDYTMSKVYKDKNNYDRLLNREYLPNTILRNMAGVYYDGDYKSQSDQNVRDILTALTKKHEKVVLKPTIITGARNKVRFVNLSEETLTFEFLENEYRQNFIIQEFIEQHNWFNQLGTTCNMRFNTYRSVSDNAIFVHEMNCSFNSGVEPDRSQYTNYIVAVDNHGKVGSISITPDRQVINVTPDGNVKFSQIGKIPKFNEIKQILTKSAIRLRFPYHRRLGFDVVVDKNEKVFIIEVNVNRLGFNISQYLSGGLFKEYTDEVIEYCNANKSRIHFPFTE